MIDRPDAFDAEFDRVVRWAHDNRAAVQAEIEAEFGELELILDLPHNTYETLADGSAIIRKGSVRTLPGELTVLPSHMGGDVVLLRVRDGVDRVLNSLSHGTGRRMPRGACKTFNETSDFAGMRRTIMIPRGVDDASLRTEGPSAYCDLDACLALHREQVDVVARYAVIGYVGRL